MVEICGSGNIVVIVVVVVIFSAANFGVSRMLHRQSFAYNTESEVAKDFAEAAEGPSVRKRKSFSIDESLLPEELTSKYEVIDKIGTGSFGAVYKFRDRKTRSMWAAKYVESKESTVAEVRLVTVTSLKPHRLMAAMQISRIKISLSSWCLLHILIHSSRFPPSQYSMMMIIFLTEGRKTVSNICTT